MTACYDCWYARLQARTLYCCVRCQRAAACEWRSRARGGVAERREEFRKAVVLCEHEEVSYGEAAGPSGCPIGTDRARLHRGRGFLMARLEIRRDAARGVGGAR